MSAPQPLLRPELIEAVAHDARKLLLSTNGFWITEMELINAMVDCGHTQTVTRLAVRWLVDNQFVEKMFRYHGPVIDGGLSEDEPVRVLPRLSLTPEKR